MVKYNMPYENKLNKIIQLLIEEDNMKTLILNPYSKMYNIEKKKGNLKEYYTARLNEKVRLVFKSLTDYPYELIEIESIELVKIDEHHYKEE